jgi:hypothetical protein
MRNDKQCSIPGCSLKHYGRNLCRKHYQQQPHIITMKNDWQKANKERRAEILHKYHHSTKHQTTHQRYRSSIINRYKILVRAAKKRNIELNLTFEEYVQIFDKGICTYCANPVGPATAMDRLDNTKGYTKDNLVGCCSDCNKLRQDRLTPAELVEVIKLLKKLRNTEDIWKKAK